VAVTHAGVTGLASPRHQLPVDAGAHVLQFLSPRLDGMLWEVFPTLLAGATVVLVPAEGDLVGPALGELVRESPCAR
jgi:non-ribosomal peptide synthetase component F